MNAHQRGLLLPPVSVALVAGVLIGRVTDSIFIPVCACILSFVSIFLLRNRLRFFACVVFCICLGFSSGTVAFHPHLPPEGDYSVSGVITDEITLGSKGQVRLVLSDVRLNNQPYTSGAYWTFYTDQVLPDLLPGKEVSFRFTILHSA